MKRLALAFLISLVGILLSWQFLRPKEWNSKVLGAQRAIARVISIQNDVARQTAGRLLWSPIRAGDEIFLGDKIKTSGLSGVVVELFESKSKLEIEENSIVLMSQGDKKLSLNMLEGRLFVNNETGASGVNLVAGGKEIDLSSNAAVSVGKDGASVVESFTSGENLFSELRPSYSETVLSEKTDIEFFWRPVDKVASVTVRIGESPVTLADVAVAPTQVSSGRVAVAAKAGINYWQLSTTIEGKKYSSPLMKLTLVRPRPPTPLFPAERETVRVDGRPFDFKWMPGNTGESVTLEVASDEEFKKIVVSSEIKELTFFTPKESLRPGSYFWRVRSATGKNDGPTSKTVPFTVYQGNEQISPTPVLPQDKAVFYADEGVARKVLFSWRNQSAGTGYELKVTGPGLEQTFQSEKESLEVSLGKVGSYSWEVVAIDQNGRKSVLPASRSLEIKRRGKIPWLMTDKKILYLKDLPVVVFRWQKNYPGISLVTVADTPDLTRAESSRAREAEFPFRVSKDGTYYAQVRALGENDEVTAESTVFALEVAEAPVPPAPVLEKNATSLTANSRGDLRTSLGNMRKGWLVIAQILDGTGRVLDERRFTEPTVTFAGLLPGSYKLNVKYSDEYQRTSESGIFALTVPDKSRLPAPKIKGIKVR